MTFFACHLIFSGLKLLDSFGTPQQKLSHISWRGWGVGGGKDSCNITIIFFWNFRKTISHQKFWFCFAKLMFILHFLISILQNWRPLKIGRLGRLLSFPNRRTGLGNRVMLCNSKQPRWAELVFCYLWLLDYKSFVNKPVEDCVCSHVV
jgi:hypothetical protein